MTFVLVPKDFVSSSDPVCPQFFRGLLPVVLPVRLLSVGVPEVRFLFVELNFKLGYFLLKRLVFSERGDSSEPYIPGWKLTAGASLNNAEVCRDLMVHLAPPSVRSEQSSLTDYQATQRAWFELACGSLAQADVLQRFENLSYHYAQLYQTHEGCGGSAGRLKELESGLAEQL